MKMFKKMRLFVFAAILGALSLSAPPTAMAADGTNHTAALAVFMAAVAVVATGGGALIVGGAAELTLGQIAWPAVIGAATAGGAAVQQYARK